MLDSFAVLAWLQDEKGSEMVENLLYSAKKRGEPLFLCVINLGEVYYQMVRRAGKDYAEAMLEKLSLLPIEILPCSYELTMDAALIKADYSISLADCFAVAAAIRQKATIFTGDPDFRKVQTLVNIEWL